MKPDLLSHGKILHVLKGLEQNPALTQRDLAQRFKKWITCDQGILRGKPVIKGTRISVELILRCMASGMTVKGILKEYPSLREEFVLAALHFATGQMSIAVKLKVPSRKCQ